jgi:hypothetical protein
VLDPKNTLVLDDSPRLARRPKRSWRLCCDHASSKGSGVRCRRYNRGMQGTPADREDRYTREEILDGAVVEGELRP